jgi:signal transduction histidine kinase
VTQESWAAIPLLQDDRALGALALGFSERREFAPEDRALIEAVAQQCAQALDRARLFDSEHAARARADEANRAKTEFLAVMSHELRTPLNAIAGYAELLDIGVHGPLTDAQRETIERIQRSQRHLLGLINDVLNFARIEAGRVELDLRPLPIHETLAGLETLVSPLVEKKRLRYRYEPCDSSLMVRADAEKIRQILLNLLSNAIKFTESRGEIVVACGDDGSTACIRVRDTGAGIPADKLERIFEPFVQLDSGRTRTHEGTGLGLSISRDLARAMGGDLTVESVLDQGSTFTLRLPLERSVL